MVAWRTWNKFPFGNKFKFETEFELKFMEEKLLLNLGLIYWGLKLVWKNLEYSPKFLFTLTMQNVNLD
jgi:hypothetical protein